MIPRHLQITFALLLAGIFIVGNYMLTLKHKAELNKRQSSGSVAPPVSAPAQSLNLYIAYDDLGVLRSRQIMVALPSEQSTRMREVLRALLNEYLQDSSPHPLGEGSDVKDVFIVNKSLAVIDLNNYFAERHRSGVWEETLTLDSLIATLGANFPEISRVKFLVEGKERDTLAGHADLVSIYDVSEIKQLVKDLQ